MSIAAFIIGSSLHWFSPGNGLDGTTTSLVALSTGAYAAGRKLTATIAGHAGYRITRVRRTTALVGGGLVLLYALRLTPALCRLGFLASGPPPR